MLCDHPAVRDKYRHFGYANYTNGLLSMTRDWRRYFCEIDFEDILVLQESVAPAGLVPYEMTTYQRRSWSGTPSRVFLDAARSRPC